MQGRIAPISSTVVDVLALPPGTRGAGLDAAEVLAEMLAEAEISSGPHEDSGPSAGSSPATRGIPLWTLLDLDGAEFVNYVYHELLDDVPDPAALAFYEAGLANGRLSKIEIVGLVRYSAAGRKMNRKVTGLLPRFLVRRSYGVPLLGHLARMAVTLLRLPGLAVELQRATKALAECQARVGKLERQVGSAPALLARLQHAENRLAALEASRRTAISPDSGE